MDYEIIVVGAGHAGCEAAYASAKKKHKTLLITGSKKNIAVMPCNPSIGGSAKGIVVREIDALGGIMGVIADQTHIQIKMLNNGKGPAVRALRAQADKITYPKKMVETLEQLPDLTILEGMVEELIIKDHTVQGVILADGTRKTAKIVILTTGTYMKADILRGSTRYRSGPNDEQPSQYLSDHLKEYGFEIQRLKTGTPPRIERSSIDFSVLRREDGDLQSWTFSHDREASYNLKEQEPCYLTYTNEQTHDIIRKNLKKSSMYGGFVEGIGPRYCPSIEDKVVRFAEKDRHQLFLEPESLFYDDIYLQGFSTSMPEDIQEQMVHSLKGLEHAIIKKYAYAIEYDAINPLQLNPSLETKIIANLFTAGQINGTSGYEEAAGQGLLAGINASLKLEGKEPLILKRNESYIGVLIDDLVTKGTKEPYRLLTSRAEYRLLLRHDNADLRLREYGYQVGLITEEQHNRFLKKITQIEELTKQLSITKITPKDEINVYLETLGSAKIQDGIFLIDLLKRPEIKIKDFTPFLKIDMQEEVIEQVEINVKYKGYIAKTTREVEHMLKYENKKIPEDLDYTKIVNLASEAKQKLDQIKPKSIGQAMRISGVNPADISVLMVYLKRYYHE